MRNLSGLCAVAYLCACSPDASSPDGGGGGGPPYPALVLTPKVHSFSFENYTNTAGITNLTPVEMLRMFGPGTCAAPPMGDTCTLTPNSEKWMEATNTAMNGGHCEGMAVASLLFAMGRLKPADFGAATAFGLSLSGNTKLQREIAYWWATQSAEPTRSSETKGATGLSPNEVVTRVRTMLATGGELYTFGLYKRDGSGGHAVNPFAVEDRAGKTYVKVYENNFPNADTMEFEIDPMANTWRYFATINPTAPADLYEGDATTKTLTLAPISVRVGLQTCPTCGTVDADGKATKGSAVSYREVTVSGDAHLLIADDQGRRLGFVGGALVNEIPGATEGPLKREPTTWNIAVDPVYRLPLGTPLTVTLDGTGLTAASTASVTLSAPGYAFSVEGVAVDPNQKDTITFSAGTQTVSYKTTSTETPTVALAVTFEGADYLFEVKSAAETGGVEVVLTLDGVHGKLKVDVHAPDGSSSYDLRIERRDTGGTAVFTHAGNALATTASVSFGYGAWTGNGSPMEAGLDTNGDGTADSTEMVSDQD